METPQTPEQIAKALVDEGARLTSLGRSEEAIRAFDDVVARFGDATETGVRRQVAFALYSKGLTLGMATFGNGVARLTLDLFKDVATELQTWDEVITRFGAASEEPFCEIVAEALRLKATRLGQFMNAHSNEGVTLLQSGRLEDSVRAFDGALGVFSEVVRLFHDASVRLGEPVYMGIYLREQLARALLSKAIVLRHLGRLEESVRAIDEFVEHMGDAPEIGFRQEVAKLLVNKAGTLRKLGRPAEAAATYDEIVTRFGAAEEAGLREVVVQARYHKSVMANDVRTSDELVQCPCGSGLSFVRCHGADRLN